MARFSGVSKHWDVKLFEQAMHSFTKRHRACRLYILGEGGTDHRRSWSVMPRQTLAGVVVNALRMGRRFDGSTNSTRACHSQSGPRDLQRHTAMPTIMRWLNKRTMARVKRGLSDRRHNPIVCPTLARPECRNSSPRPRGSRPLPYTRMNKPRRAAPARPRTTLSS